MSSYFLLQERTRICCIGLDFIWGVEISGCFPLLRMPLVMQRLVSHWYVVTLELYASIEILIGGKPHHYSIYLKMGLNHFWLRNNFRGGESWLLCLTLHINFIMTKFFFTPCKNMLFFPPASTAHSKFCKAEWEGCKCESKKARSMSFEY